MYYTPQKNKIQTALLKSNARLDILKLKHFRGTLDCHALNEVEGFRPDPLRPRLSTGLLFSLT